jgi:nicotinate phosphoribosyltransferase
MKDKFVSARTDKYFTKTKNIVQMFGDRTVTYGVFQRRDVVVATQLAVDLIQEKVPEATIIRHFEDGTVVPPKTKVLTITGPFSKLVELETLFLQRVGFAQVAAYNAYKMAMALPQSKFLDMHGRHATGDDMMIAAAYGASVGSRTARLQGAKGFIGTSNDLTAHFYPIKVGLGTMPHAVVGYAGSTVRSLEMYIEANPEDQNIVALVDYFGKEVTDSIAGARWFYDTMQLDKKGKTYGVRLDTNGERFLEGLDWEKSVEVVCKWIGVYPADEYAAVRKVVGDQAFDAAAPDYIDKVRRILFGKGVSAANLMHMRRSLNKAGYARAQIVASSGFDLFKCQIMAAVNAPIDTVGTGSFLPKTLSETYATADIYKYDDELTVKVGREWLFD